MKKRVLKKVGRYKCPRHSQREGGVFKHYQLKTGRWVSSCTYCFICGNVKDGRQVSKPITTK